MEKVVRAVKYLGVAAVLAMSGPAVARDYYRPMVAAPGVATPFGFSPWGPPVPAARRSYRARGGGTMVATWYGGGERLSSHTASGERFNRGGLTAAHRTLPFGTRLRVTNPRTGLTTVVRVNDRGPFANGASLDLARGAARAIGMTSKARLIVAILGRE